MRRSLFPVIFSICLAAIHCNRPAEHGNELPATVQAGTVSEKANQQNATVEKILPAVNKSFERDYLMGKFDPSAHPDFTTVDVQHADREGLFLRRDTYTAFVRMYDAAKNDGVRLQIRSATRNFNYQKGIWERKWTGETKIENGKDASVAYPDPVDRARAILLYSSMPGTSRHHWGTDIDLNSFNNDWFGEGEGLRLYRWMNTHAHHYGFCQPYSDKSKENRTGYEEERWHWSYMPVSIPLTRQAGKELANDMITGFMGAEAAEEVDMVGNYVLGISSNCLAQQHSSGE